MNALLPNTVHIDLLGALQALQGDRRITRFPTYKTGALLAYLAYFRDRTHPREILIELFWPDGTLERGRNNLSIALSALRHLLEPPGVPTGAVVLADRFTTRLNPISVTTDVATFEAALRAAASLPRGSARAQHLTDAIQCYQGPLLPGYYEGWVLSEQARLEDQFFQAIQALVAYCEETGDRESALKFARRAVSADPLREETHRTVIRLLIAAGRREQAAQQFHELEAILNRNGAGAPAAETLALLKQSKPGEPPLSTEQIPVQREPLAAQRVSAPVETAPAPMGTVTFLLTDIEGSTAHWRQAGRAFQAALSLHHMLLRQEFRRLGGFEANEKGGEDGSGFRIAFARPMDAVACAVAAQKALFSQPWPEQVGSLRVCMALHTGEVEWEEGAYRGLTLHRASRLLAAAHGGQILCSEATAGLVRRDLEPGLRLTDLGVYRLRDVELPEQVKQIEYPGMMLREHPPIKAEPHHTGHLPVTLTRFFGRELELARLREMLTDSETRLITLTGTGGTGKTRLAVEAARQSERMFAGAVWFAPLAQVVEAEPLARALLDALRLTPSPQIEPLEQVIRALTGRQTLLVLDNLEQLAAAGGPVVQTLLERAPDLKLLATSRQRLNLPGEREMVVPPLSTPDGNHTLERLSLFDSVRLFVDRAQGVRPDFQITTHNAPATAELCCRLEGIPLAIELAAARAQVLTPLQMLAQLQNRFDFLVSRRSSEARHKTLRAALEWSYRLLSAELQRFFARLSVFRGGWTAETAEAVCEAIGAEDAGPEMGMALDYLAELRECSLVIAEEQEEGEMRFRMLETVREYAEDQLSAMERAAVWGRHLEFFAGLAEEADAKLEGPASDVAMKQLTNEHDNLKAALERSRSIENAALPALRLSGGLGWFWLLTGYVKEGWTYVAEALAREGAQERTAARAKALDTAATLRLTWGGYSPAANAEALPVFEECLALCREVGDRRGIAHALLTLGSIRSNQGDFAEAQSLIAESITINQELGNLQDVLQARHTLWSLAHSQSDPTVTQSLYEQATAAGQEALAMAQRQGNSLRIGDALQSLGWLADAHDDYVAAQPYYEEALAIWRKLGAKRNIAHMLGNLGGIAFSRSDYAQARHLFEELLPLRRETGDQLAVAYGLNNLGWALTQMNDALRARSRLEEALRMFRELGDPHGISMTLHSLATAAYSLSDYPLAYSLYREGLQIQRDLKARRTTAYLLEGLAATRSAQGQAWQAAQLCGAVEALRAKRLSALPSKERDDYERLVASIRAALKEEVFEAAYTKGRAMTMEQAVEYALSETD